MNETIIFQRDTMQVPLPCKNYDPARVQIANSLPAATYIFKNSANTSTLGRILKEKISLDNICTCFLAQTPQVMAA